MLTVDAGVIGSAALSLAGTLAGNSSLIVNNSATTGAQTATFQANNKPGTPPTNYGVVATSGGHYTNNFSTNYYRLSGLVNGYRLPGSAVSNKTFAGTVLTNAVLLS